MSLLCNVEHKLMLTEEQRTKTRRTSCLLQSRGGKDNNYGPPQWAACSGNEQVALARPKETALKHTWDKHTQSNRDELTRK